VVRNRNVVVGEGNVEVGFEAVEDGERNVDRKQRSFRYIGTIPQFVNQKHEGGVSSIDMDVHDAENNISMSDNFLTFAPL
jgi:hypothetical protein